MYCYDLEVMISYPSWIKLGVRSTSVKVVLDPKTSKGFLPMLQVGKCWVSKSLFAQVSVELFYLVELI